MELYGKCAYCLDDNGKEVVVVVIVNDIRHYLQSLSTSDTHSRSLPLFYIYIDAATGRCEYAMEMGAHSNDDDDSRISDWAQM